MAGSILKRSEIKQALKKERLNFKIHNSKLNGTENSITFIDKCSKKKIRGKILRSFNEGEVHHWPLMNHENVAKLIDILRIRTDIYIYLSVDHEMTLKNIVHDENFVYDDRCFDRKRSYAKGIFSGLSYLHGKALTLKNLCDDNIAISTTDDRAVITNFDHLTNARKATKSRLNMPEMYMAPETEKGEFDASKAEIWASGILMLDMFIAHMVPWAVVSYKPKNVMQVVDMISLDLLQAANAGSIVSAADLEKFKAFLKCFFKQNPQERITAKYASIASFLQNGDQHKILRDSYESIPYPECVKLENYSNLDLPEEAMTICLNRIYDSSSYSEFPSAHNTEILSTNTNPCIAETKTQQTKRSTKVQVDKNEMEVEKSLSETSNTFIEGGKNEKISSTSSHKSIVFIADSGLKSDFQKTSKSWETVKERVKSANKSNYNCCQANSLSFIKPERCSNNTTAFQLLSKRSCNSNDEPSEKQLGEYHFQSSDFGLNLIFNSNDTDEIGSNPNNNSDNNSVVECGCLNAATGKNNSEIIKNQIKTQVKQNIPPWDYVYNTSLQTSTKHIAIPPRKSKASPPSFAPEIKSITSKIIYLRKCFYSIQTHQKVEISKEFGNKQSKIVEEYQNLILEYYFRLYETLRKKYELKTEDVTKLISYINSGNQCVSLNQNLNENHWNRLLKTREMLGAIKDDIASVKSHSDNKLKNTNILTVKIHRNHSYYRAIENGEINPDRKWEIKDKDNKLEWGKANFVSNNRMKPGYVTAAAKNDKMNIEGLVHAKKTAMVEQREQWRRSVKTADEINCYGARPKQAGHDGAADIGMLKQHEQNRIGQTEKYLNAADDANYNIAASAQKAKNKYSKNKNKGQGINTKGKLGNRKKPDKKEKQKLSKSKQSIEEKAKKKEKMQLELEKQKKSKSSRCFSMCLGGSIQERTLTADAFCETCKLYLEID